MRGFFLADSIGQVALSASILPLFARLTIPSLLLIAIEILSLRKSMWEKVTSRKHTPIKIFPFGAWSDEVMLYGTVEYKFKEGGEKVVDWGARAKLVKQKDENGTGEQKVKLVFYQVYMVSSRSPHCRRQDDRKIVQGLESCRYLSNSKQADSVTFQANTILTFEKDTAFQSK